MTRRTLREADQVWVCDGCGSEAREWKGWLRVDGTWDSDQGADRFYGHFCPVCIPKIGSTLFPMSVRNRDAVVPRLFR
jgi:hypothetical protein